MKKHLIAAFAAVALVSGCASNAPVEEDVNVNVAVEEGQESVMNAKDRVYFGFDQYNLTNEAMEVLQEQARFLVDNPETSVVVEGHTDDRGTRDYNLALGERRAVSVKNYLIANGVDAGRIRVISYGKERPAVVGANEAAWAQNRRAVTVVK